MEIAKLVLEFLRVLIWPIVIFAVIIIFRTKLEAILWRLRKAVLPGGVSLDFDQEIREAKDLSKQVVQQIEAISERNAKGPVPSIPLTEANARMLKLGLRPSPSGLDSSYYRKLVAQDPNLALAGIRIEIDVLANNLAKGFGVEVSSRDSGGRLLKKLFDAGAITREQMQLGLKVLALCNAAIHGQMVSRAEAEEVITIAEILMEQYIRWLSWGFQDGWEPTKTNRAE